MEDCPLCGGQRPSTLPVSPHPGGHYLHCGTCDLIYATRSGIISPAEEREQYLLHDNSHDNAGYVAMLSSFLERAVLPFSRGGTALDFGCGPGPVLGDLLERAGFSVSIYDPFFRPGRSVLSASYDVITSTEVLEHVDRAWETWQTLARALGPGGVLAVMTHLHPGREEFGDWWYHRDPTHIRFYSRETLDWIASRLDLEILFTDGVRTVTLARPGGGVGTRER